MKTKMETALVAVLLLSTISCKKEIDQPAKQQEIAAAVINGVNGELNQTKTFSADVAQKWQDLQLRFLQLPTTTNPYGRHGHRWFAYCGIALYESVVPGMPAYQSLARPIKVYETL